MTENGKKKTEHFGWIWETLWKNTWKGFFTEWFWSMWETIFNFTAILSLIFFFYMNERSFKFYGALQISSFIHKISNNPIITLFFLLPTSPLLTGNHWFVLYVSPLFLLLLNSVVCCIILDFRYKWYHAVFLWYHFLCLMSLSIIPSMFIHVVANGRISFSLWLSNIQLYIYTYHIFIIHSSVDGHLVCFLTLTTIIMLLWNLGCLYLFEIVFLVFFQIYTQKWNCGSYGSSIFRFLRNLWAVFHSGYTNYIPTNSIWGFPFHYILTNICYWCTFWW